MMNSYFISYKDVFKDHLFRCGIKSGDIIYVASDMTGMMINAKKQFNVSIKDKAGFCDLIINSLQEVVGGEGQLLIPVYTWDYCRCGRFDHKNTLGEVGVLGNHALKHRSDFKRTTHPIYSFMVWGKDSDYLYSLQNQESWGIQSPYEYLLNRGAKQLSLNVNTERSFTFVHYIENRLNVPYRYNKYFIGHYTDDEGNTERRCYSMYVRDLDIQMKGVLDDEFFVKKKIATRVDFGKSFLMTIDFKKSLPVFEDDFIKNSGRNVYCFDSYEIEWNKPTHVPEIKCFDMEAAC